MQLILPELVGDLGDHLLAAELNLGICRPWDDRSGRVEWKSTALNSTTSARHYRWRS